MTSNISVETGQWHPSTDLLFWRQVINGDIHDVLTIRHLESTRLVPPGVPKSVLMQNQHPTPSTQQAERSWLKTRARSESVLVNFPETDKG
jgi:hypothetical protein